MTTAFSASLDLDDLDGVNGFRIDGVNPGDQSGSSVSGAGDVNGDGITDFLVGAPLADLNGNILAGVAYLVFGSTTGFPANSSFTDLDGTNGFRIEGIGDIDHLGASVSAAGDVNGDGIDDFLVGARTADPGGISGAGATYVVFGSTAGFPARLPVAELDGANGFQIAGIKVADQSGWSVSGAGDVNGDGIDDILVGAPSVDADDGFQAGAAYVVFGSADGFSASLSLADLDGANGFSIQGAAAFDGLGRSVSGAGDVNADGIDDILLGAPFAADRWGETFVVFGSAGGFSATVSVADLDGRNGFRIPGVEVAALNGLSVSGAGDVNGDGIDDILVSAPRAAFDRQVRQQREEGDTYVVFGSAEGFSASLSPTDLDGTNGLRIVGTNSTGQRAASAAGDVNGDGIDDLVMAARGNSEPINVLFGSTEGFPATVSLSDLDGATGLRIDGATGLRLDGEPGGFTVSGPGDVNGDGIDDILAGFGRSTEDAGASYVIFGAETVNEPPSVMLENPVGALPEDTDTTAPVRVATIVVTDDARGENTLALSGADAGLFAIDGDGLYLRAQTALDFETDDALAVMVTVDDPAVGTTPDDAASLAIAVTDVDEPVVGTPPPFTVRELARDGTVVGTIPVAEPDAGPITFAITAGNTGGAFAIGPASGTLTVERPQAIVDGNGPFLLEVTATTTDGRTDTVAVPVTVEDLFTIEATGADVAGTAGDDALLLGAGGDDARAGSGDDVVLAGAGDDVVRGQRGDDEMYGNAGDDVLRGAGGKDLLVGGGGADTLRGGRDGDHLIGSRGDDLLVANAGRDILQGGAGDDELRGGGGFDALNGGRGRDTLVGSAGNDALDGARGRDQLRGGNGDDLLEGGARRDVLRGDAGSDTLAGEGGNDRLFGGAGADHFRFEEADFGADVVRDFDLDEDRLVFAEDAVLTVNARGNGAEVVVGQGTVRLTGVDADALAAHLEVEGYLLA